MSDLSIYGLTDFVVIRDFIESTGESVALRRGGLFCRMDECAPRVGIVKSGAFAFMRPDSRGNEQVMTLSFPGDLVGAYVAVEPGNKSYFDVKALCASEILAIGIVEFLSFLESVPGKNFSAWFAKTVAFEFMMRGASFRCDTPEERYLALCARVPGHMDFMSNTDVASYLGISREGFSRMRSRLTRGSRKKTRSVT